MNGHGLKIAALESRMGYVFKDKSLIGRALTHSSYGDGQRKIANYERLEFLGDRVLGLLTAEMLFHATQEDEGALARRLNALVRKETCARVSRAIGVSDALLMSQSEDKQGGREKTSILGDACESILGAIYLDGGIEAAKVFYDKFWAQEIEFVMKKAAKDPKTQLQEKSSIVGGGAPDYRVIEQSGPDHRPLFVVEVDVAKIGSARGTGKSKKDAERYAAQHLLENWPL
ncbi:ribonuclease III [Fretibacter rubidus]|uniref:ribonuclease III n=1 Tax=Fretibacter rubidus TaxID=570162 RepID=UPI00352AA6AB